MTVRPDYHRGGEYPAGDYQNGYGGAPNPAHGEYGNGNGRGYGQPAPGQPDPNAEYPADATSYFDTGLIDVRQFRDSYGR